MAGQHKNANLQAAFDSDPNFSISFQLTESKEEALSLESEVIKQHFDSGELFNISPDARVANKGVLLKEDRKATLSKLSKEKFEDPTYREKHRQAVVDKWTDPIYRAKHEGQISSEVKKKAIADSVREKWKDDTYRERVKESRKHLLRPVVIDGVTYESAASAAVILKIAPSTLRDRLKKFNPKE